MLARSKPELRGQRPRNDPKQYDDLVDAWWEPRGPLAMLHWIAKARGQLVPVARREHALLVDLGCGGGLLAPHLTDKGYQHLGIDLNLSALKLAAFHGTKVIAADIFSIPLADEVADVVSAGEILEHVADHRRAIAEACRILRPGGVLVIDTIASTWIARVLAVHIAERIPGGAPKNIHDPRLFVDRHDLIAQCAANGVEIKLSGLRPSLISMIAWLSRRRPSAKMIRTPLTAVLFQGVGVKKIT